MKLTFVTRTHTWTLWAMIPLLRKLSTSQGNVESEELIVESLSHKHLPNFCKSTTFTFPYLPYLSGSNNAITYSLQRCIQVVVDWTIEYKKSDWSPLLSAARNIGNVAGKIKKSSRRRRRLVRNEGRTPTKRHDAHLRRRDFPRGKMQCNFIVKKLRDWILLLLLLLQMHTFLSYLLLRLLPH